MAANWATSLTLSGREWMSSMKLTPAARVTAMRNQMFWKPKKAAHIHSPSTKMMPPPRSTMLLCEERWLGLSMMLHLSAMRKYTNSAARSRAVINKYLTSSHISVKIIQFDRLFYSTIPKCHFTTYYRCICRNLQQEDNFPCSLHFE